MQKIVLRIIFESFRIIFLKILKKETHVQLIHFYLSQLQTAVRDRLIKHEHRILIDNFFNRIKSRFVDARERRRQRDVLTSNERKQ